MATTANSLSSSRSVRPIRIGTRLDESKLNIASRSRTSRLPWRGQFSPELVEYLIETLCPDSLSFLDPFCGSGTVLFEAVKYDRVAIGCEVNPAAWHLAALSTFPSLSRADKNGVVAELTKLHVSLSSDDFGLFRTNCSPQVILTGLWRSETHPFFSLVLAASVLLGMGDGREFTRANLVRGLEAILVLLRELSPQESPSNCYLADARQIPLPRESVDAVITSPPYINVFNYHHNYRSAVELLGWRPLEAASSEIGANRKHRQNRFLTVVQYCLDMAKCIETMAFALKIGAPIAIVVGRTSNVLGAPFANSFFIKQLMEASGAFSAIQFSERVFVNRFGLKIYEDVLYALREGAPQISEKVARKVGLDAITRAIAVVPEKNSQALHHAIEVVDSIQPSPLLEISRPTAFAFGNGTLLRPG